MDTIKTQYRQKLPHYQPVGASFFVTFRLFESIPKEEIIKLKKKFDKKIFEANQIKNKSEKYETISKIRRQYFVEFDMLLDTITDGPEF